MTSRLAAAGVAALVAAGSCTDGSAPDADLTAPAAITARALGMHVVRVEWTPASGGVESYRLERRVNLTGPFVIITPALTPVSAGAVVSFLDVDVEPETFYGYRVFALGSLGDESRPSVVAGARTPPPPGIDVQTSSTVPVPDAADPDGYWVSVAGPATAAAPLGVNDQRRFTPLAPGAYTVTLSGVRSSCDLQDAPTQAVTVSDTGLQTVAAIAFRVVCHDPARGRIRGTVVADGDSADPNGFRVTGVGLLADTALPDSQRIVHLETGVSGAGGSFAFDGLLPGSYDVSLDDVAAHCSVAGERVRQVTVAPLRVDTLQFDVACLGSGGAGRPFVWRNSWSPASAQPGAKVALDIALDVSANAGQQVGGVQSELRYNAALLRFDSARAGALTDQFTINPQTAGLVSWLALRVSNPPGGTVSLGRFHFTVTGAAGSAAATRTTITEVLAGDLDTRIDTLIRVVEDTLPVTGGGGNQPPVADANGPYGGAVSTPISFSSAGSSDPDGTIASYAWAFGDGGSAVGATPSHSYSAAGTYTARLTVTDNLGATATDQVTVSVTNVGGASPFTWRGQFGAINPADSVVALTLTLDLTTDIAETPGPEALATFVIDSLKWDPTVLRYHAFNWGPGGAGGVQTTHAMQGKLIVTSFTLPTTANSGLVQLATIRFKSIPSSRSTTTASAVGPLIGTPATGAFNYRSRTGVVEATFTSP